MAVRNKMFQESGLYDKMREVNFGLFFSSELLVAMYNSFNTGMLLNDMESVEQVDLQLNPSTLV